MSDNLKSAVTRASKYEPEINRSLKDFAHHYNCVVNPTRSYSPQDKALVENAVQLAYQRIYYPMREMTFFSLEDLNKEIQKLLSAYNDLLFQRKEASRRDQIKTLAWIHKMIYADDEVNVKEAQFLMYTIKPTDISFSELKKVAEKLHQII